MLLTTNMFVKHVTLPFYILFAVSYEMNHTFCVLAATDEKPLILTPYIKNGKIAEARNLSKVDPEQFDGTQSYSGFFAVNQQHNSNLFFWFFPSQTDYPNAPLILWLDGGPGESNMMSIFGGIGPLHLTGDGYPKRGEYSFTKHHSVLYIDNPVGTGYSFTDKDGYVKNETIIGTELYEALQQFFQLFHETQNNDFYVYGISYGGKYAPSLSHTIHHKNKSAKEKINLKGMILANSWSDPLHQAMHSEYLYQIGLIDGNTKIKFREREYVLRNHINGKQWKAATEEYNKIILSYNDSLYKSVTGFVGFHNFLQQVLDLKEYNAIENYVNKSVREALHIGNTLPYCAFCENVFYALEDDMMQSVSFKVSELLDHYRVLIYTGQLDILVAYPMTVNFLRHLQFKGADEYASAIRRKWYVDNELAGYTKQVGTLTEVLVRNAGHSAAFDKPQWALDVITRFISNQTLS
ncbi:hypothetical protein ILUMI_06002 [Ignelater luminosus]|uniref:Serine carboxypeptidase n=1 Tax=Ignelater luminosus TaxID=2038154 RepID=A0A8K0D9F2_IGNLU|nr:hypothetical protein ILUMI_06002 [Ignelater luminosus]